MKRISGLLLTGALLLTGCATAPEQTEIVPVPTQEQEPPAEMKFCEETAAGLLEYTDFVTKSMTEGVDADVYAAQESYIENLGALVPAEGEDALSLYGDFITQIQDIIAGGGTGTLESATFKQGVLDVLEYCVDVGYNEGF